MHIKEFLLACILYFSFVLNGISQTTIYRDIVNGGVTGAGFSSGVSSNAINANIIIDLGTATGIVKSFLIFYAYNTPDDIVIEFNGQSYIASESNKVTPYWNANPIGSQKISIHVIDVTQSIIPSQNNYSLKVPNQDATKRYACFYIVSIYESVSVKNTSVELIVNNQSLSNETIYDFLNLNPISLLDDVGLAIQTDILWDDIIDGSSILVNGNNLGAVGGSDSNNSLESGAGVKGHFNYNDGILYGLDDDTADPLYSGSDGLAIINSNLLGLNQFELKLVSQNTPMVFNSYVSFPLVYTTPCDTFSVTVPNDTTVCQGTQLQLNATGGTSTGSLPTYEWTPSTGLSCNTCPNPIFTADSSMFYTVRIRNNDSCSVVRPVKINVRPRPTFGGLTTTASECGASTGSSTLFALPNNGIVTNWQEVGGTTQTSNIFNGLSAGNHVFFFIDTNGCQSADSIVFIDEVNSTVADFTANPMSGAAPLDVSFTNTSQNATNYAWNVNGNNLSNYTFDPSGTYVVTLVAWQNDPSCADTAYKTIFVYDSLLVEIPNIFTPNGDGVNDFFSINSNMPINCHLVIVNRWGNVMHEFNGDITAGTTNLWDASTVSTSSTASSTANEGTYFYRLRFDASSETPEGVKLVLPLEKEGFVMLVE